MSQSPDTTSKAKPTRAETNAKLRVEAGIFYMTDQSAPSLEAMSADSRFKKVSLKTLERWCKDDSWVERRTAFFKKWNERAKARIGTELCRIRQRDLADLETIRNMALEKLSDELTMPKSWEGVAKILLEATEHRDRLATAIGAELMPSNGGEQKMITPQEVGVAPEELQLAAKAILQQRREALRLAAGTATPLAPVVIDAQAATVPTSPVAAHALAPEPVQPAQPVLSIGVGDEDDEDEEEEEP